MENNIEIQKFCEEIGITFKQFIGEEVINRSNLFLPYLTELPIGFNPKISGNLVLNDIIKIIYDFKPIVYGNLYLADFKEITNIFNPVVGGSLFLPNLKKISNIFNPIINGSIYLNKLKEIPKDLKLVVGNDLWLSDLIELPDYFKHIFGGNLYYNNDKICIKSNLTKNDLISWHDDKYIKIDGIFTEVIEKTENIYRVKELNRDKICYLITDETYYAHGDDIDQSRINLFVKQCNGDINYFKNFTLNSFLTVEEAIACYNIICGAFDFGINKLITKDKDKYTIKEMIELTKDEYRNYIFKEYFNLK